jgi:phosphoribosylformylglycinamidine synthase
MCLAGRLGAQVRLADVAGDEMPDHVRLFSESLCRFVVEVHPSDAPAFEELLSDQPWALLGEVSSTPELVVQGRDGAECLREDVAALEAAWRDIPPAPPVAAETPTEPPAPATPESIALDAMGQIDQGLRASLRPLIYDRTFEQAPVTTQTPRVLVLHANGTNRDRDAALACWMAGGDPEVVHVSQLLGGDRNLLDYHMLVVPGGFSYGDDLGAGTLWALDLRSRLGESVARFVASGRPVLGICNGFQALVKAGLLPGALQLEVPDAARLALPNTARTVTLAPNHRGHFECRWVHLQPQPNSPCVFTQGMSEPLHCPVAHGEGRVQARDDATLRELTRLGLVALTYTAADGAPAAYPGNPNGSALDIAGLCNMEGNVLGLMPHPENHIFPWQHPRWQRGASGMFGLRLFANGLKSVR